MVGGGGTGGRKETGRRKRRRATFDGCSIHIERIFKAGINSGELLIRRRQIELGTQKPLSLSFSPPSFVKFSLPPPRNALLTKYPFEEVRSIQRKIFENEKKKKEGRGKGRRTSINGDPGITRV